VENALTDTQTEVGLKELLRAGVHFGHQTHRWNPKMRKYIFAERGGIYLIDLKKTLHELDRARALVREKVVAGQSVLFVCTKTQLAPIVQEEAERSGSFYVTQRWLGGMLTNFQTIRKNIKRLKELEQGAEEGSFEFYTKKEQLLLGRERQKLDRYLSGIKSMNGLPGVVFVVDSNKEEIAVREANRLGIPVVAIADTNADPDLLTVAIAGNDDAIRSVSLITRAIADTIEAARREKSDMPGVDEEAEAYTYSTDAAEVEDTSRSQRKRPRPRRRPRPEAIAQRMHHPPATESGAEGAEGEGGQAEGEAKDAPEGKDAPEAKDQPEAEVKGAVEAVPEDADDGASGGS
jgi:small subunit ribosomal protein S2